MVEVVQNAHLQILHTIKVCCQLNKVSRKAHKGHPTSTGHCTVRITSISHIHHEVIRWVFLTESLHEMDTNYAPANGTSTHLTNKKQTATSILTVKRLLLPTQGRVARTSVANTRTNYFPVSCLLGSLRMPDFWVRTNQVFFFLKKITTVNNFCLKRNQIVFICILAINPKDTGLVPFETIWQHCWQKREEKGLEQMKRALSSTVVQRRPVLGYSWGIAGAGGGEERRGEEQAPIAVADNVLCLAPRCAGVARGETFVGGFSRVSEQVGIHTGKTVSCNLFWQVLSIQY